MNVLDDKASANKWNPTIRNRKRPQNIITRENCLKALTDKWNANTILVFLFLPYSSSLQTNLNASLTYQLSPPTTHTHMHKERDTERQTERESESEREKREREREREERYLNLPCAGFVCLIVCAYLRHVNTYLLLKFYAGFHWRCQQSISSHTNTHTHHTHRTHTNTNTQVPSHKQKMVQTNKKITESNKIELEYPQQKNIKFNKCDENTWKWKKKYSETAWLSAQKLCMTK